MNARRLLYWGDLEETRRRRARGGLAGLPPWLYSMAAGLVLAVLVARDMGALGALGAPAGAAAGGLASAAATWLAVLAGGHVLVLFGAPFRLFWRRDAALIGRLAVPGRVLFQVALARSVRATLRVLVPCLLALPAFALGPAGEPALVLRHLVLAIIAALGAGLLGPAVTLAAGAMVASDKAQQIMGNLGGEVQAPRSSWLGLLPGLTGAALVLALLAAAPWARGAERVALVGDPMLLLGLAAGLPLVSLAWALARADAVMLDALREVAALDQERLAHVELVEPSRLDRLIAAGFLGGSSGGAFAGAAAVFAKDSRLARRRYPIPFFLGLVGLASLLIVAAARPASMLLWAGVIAAGLGAYGVVMARRLVSAPIEHPVFLRTLPVGGRPALRAKRARVLLWSAWYIVPGALAVVARAGANAGLAALILGAVIMASAMLGMAALGSDQD